MSIEKKLIPIHLDIADVDKNDTERELKLIVAILEAAIHRCCKGCDEPVEIMATLKKNGFLFR